MAICRNSAQERQRLPSWRGLPARVEPDECSSRMVESLLRAFDTVSERAHRKTLMQNLSPRHVKTEESVRLGVISGWYSTKVSGTFVTGPHDTEADCLRKIAEIDPPPPPPKKKR